MNNNISSLFFNAAERNATRIAIISKHGQVTYAELKNQVQRTASYFTAKGISHGDRVLVFVPMSIDLYRIVLALFQIGASAVFLDEWVSRERLEACCRLAKCKGFIAPWKLRILSVVSKELRAIPVHLSSTKMCTKKGEQIAETQGDETALVTFTTGTTGIPKAARRTHAYLNAQFNALQPLITSAHIEVDMPMLPIVLFLNLALGRTSVIADFKPSKPAGFAAGKVVDQIIAHGVQGLTASPYYITSISNYLLSSGTKPAQVKQVISGGAPVFPDDAAIMQLAFPNSGVHIVYGSTEAEPISSITAADLVSNHADISKGLCVGTVDSSATVCIIQIKPGAITGNEFASLKLEDEQVGEICVSGDHVLSEYLDNPEATALNKINVNGTIWHRTGDAGCIRSGKLFLLGRCAQIIQFEDHVFYPFLIESLIKNHTRGMMGTMLNAGTPLVVIESGDQTVLSKLKEDLYASQPVFNRLRYMALQNIPRDPRHHSRIDYAKLKELVNQSSES